MTASSAPTVVLVHGAFADAAGGPDLYIDSATFRETFCADNPDTERFMANRMGGTVETIQASHVAFISRPVETAEFIMSALP